MCEEKDSSLEVFGRPKFGEVFYAFSLLYGWCLYVAFKLVTVFFDKHGIPYYMVKEIDFLAIALFGVKVFSVFSFSVVLIASPAIFAVMYPTKMIEVFDWNAENSKWNLVGIFFRMAFPVVISFCCLEYRNFDTVSVVLSLALVILWSCNLSKRRLEDGLVFVACIFYFLLLVSSDILASFLFGLHTGVYAFACVAFFFSSVGIVLWIHHVFMLRFETEKAMSLIQRRVFFFNLRPDYFFVVILALYFHLAIFHLNMNVFDGNLRSLGLIDDKVIFCSQELIGNAPDFLVLQKIEGGTYFYKPVIVVCEFRECFCVKTDDGIFEILPKKVGFKIARK